VEPDPPKGAAQPVVDVPETLVLARFFLDRGEYDSAIEEIEGALRRAPESPELREALASAKSAKAAEESVLGGE
jgi:predicted Zn-dependent protease